VEELGGPAVADRVAPGILDRLLARSSHEDQRTDEPVEPDRPANLFEPAPADVAAHGPFDDRARERRLLLWTSLHREWLGLPAGAGLTGAAVAAFQRRRAR
jgi:hypothetical protein